MELMVTKEKPSSLCCITRAGGRSTGARSHGRALRCYRCCVIHLLRTSGLLAVTALAACGPSFAELAAREPGATRFSSGLVLRVMKPGPADGATPGPTDRVRVHYHGTFTDGEVFDSSVQRGEPAEFPLDHVIKCWTEALQQMKVGEKARLVCPSEIAYGASGQGTTIPGGATLVFEVELLAIVK